MTKRRKILIFTLILLVSIGGGINYYNYMPGDINKIDLPDLEPKEFKLTTDDYVEDFLFVYETLEENYPFFDVNKKAYGIDWLANKEKYIEEISKAQNDQDFFSRMNYILRSLNNGHTHLMPDYAAIRHYLIYYPAPKSSWRHDKAKIYEKERVRRRYGIDNLLIKNYIETNLSKDSFQVKNKAPNLQIKNVIDGDLGYIKVSSMNYDTIEKDQVILDQGLDKFKDYPNIIIDIRGNTGGATDYWKKFLLPRIIDKPYQTDVHLFMKAGDLNKKIIKQEKFKSNIEKFLTDSSFNDDTKKIIKNLDCYYSGLNQVTPDKNSINFKGNIYLLVDSDVFSASESMASFCKESGLATLVGTKTGGDGIGFDPMEIDLPNTGFVLRYSCVIGVTESGSINDLEKTTPHIEVISDDFDEYLPLREQKTIRAVIKDANLEF